MLIVYDLKKSRLTTPSLFISVEISADMIISPSVNSQNTAGDTGSASPLPLKSNLKK